MKELLSYWSQRRKEENGDWRRKPKSDLDMDCVKERNHELVKWLEKMLMPGMEEKCKEKVRLKTLKKKKIETMEREGCENGGSNSEDE